MGLKWHEHLNLASKIFYLIEPVYTFCNNTSNTIKGHFYDCSCSRTDRFITIYLFILFACRTAPNMKLQTRLLSCTDVLSSCVLEYCFRSYFAFFTNKKTTVRTCSCVACFTIDYIEQKLR